MLRRLRSVVTAFVAIAVLRARPDSAQAIGSEYQVKAAFLYHFTQLVEWPDSSGGDQAMTFCAFADDAHRDQMQHTFEGKQVGMRPLYARAISGAQDAQGCSILFFSENEANRQGAVMKALHGAPVLTVGESDEFLASGGMIRFHIEQGKVRFDVNVSAAQSARLKISSRLLLLASHVMYDANADAGEK